MLAISIRSGYFTQMQKANRMTDVLPETMKCPHCLVSFHVQAHDRNPSWVNSAKSGHWWHARTTCPGCNDIIIWLVVSEGCHKHPSRMQVPEGACKFTMVFPKASGRPPVPTEVPAEFAEDYAEACLVIGDSPKASAALSRRCLQLILREKAEVKNPNHLATAIEEVVNDPSVPSDISRSLDVVRNIGNFSAHPNKSVNTGEIVPVEEGEAEWCLEVIEILFDYYFVRPADVKRRTLALNQKLSDTGKPQMPVT